MFATGYNYAFPYMPSSAVYRSGHRVGLYKHVFPPDLEHPTLAVVGFIHALGAIMPQAEIQARWVARVFKGEAEFLLHQQRRFFASGFTLRGTSGGTEVDARTASLGFRVMHMQGGSRGRGGRGCVKGG